MRPALSGFAASLAMAAAASAVAPPAPHGATPTPAQVKHAERAYYAFCHFTVNTFKNREWGTGGESESVFNPTAFDANQIIGALAAGGAKGMILTCKHHDGFCLWPTATTPHNISRSPFRGGRGDVVREFSEACSNHGIGFGVYVSPWDRNNPLYGTPEYVTDVLRRQLEELLTGYGPVFEVWFDGANGGTGYYKGLVGPEESQDVNERRGIDNTTYYRWPETWARVLQMQPEAIIFSDIGPGVRWVGNERGWAPDPCRPTITYPPGSTAGSNIPNLGPGTHGGEQWVPAEVDVSIRPGWFWHESENNKVRSPENLMKLYLESVGRGATLNLNVPPDRRGLLHENDVESLRLFGEHLRATFAENLAAGAHPAAADVRGNDDSFGPHKLLDDDPWSAWITNDGVTTPELILTLPEERTFNLIRLREDIRLGLRVEGVAVDAWRDGAWHELAAAEVIGQCRLWRVPQTTTRQLRIRVTKSPVCPALSDFGLFLEPDFANWIPPLGADPRAVAKARWKIHSASAENPPGGAARHAIDGRPDTIWHTHGDDGEHTLPQHIAVDMGEEKTLAGFTCLPRQDGTRHGMVDAYEFHLSTDGQTWTRAAAGEFGNLRANPVEQSVAFPPAKARYFRFTATRALEKNHAVVAELGVIEAPAGE